MDNFNLRKYLAEGRLFEQEMTPEKWISLGSDFIKDEDEDWYEYYGILFFDNPEKKELRAEIQYGDYSEEEFKAVEQKMGELENILDANNYEWSSLSKSFGIDFFIYY